MDPATGSRGNFAIPMLPPIGLAPVPTGPHYYKNRSWVGSVLQGNTPQQAFESLSRHATPLQEGASVSDGGRIEIPGLGPIRQHVDPDHLTIVNTAEPGHVLYPGNVFRSIAQDGDDLYVVTEGYGSGVFPKENELAGPYLWKLTDEGIRSDLNPRSTAPYPADKMGAVGSPSGVDPMNLPRPQLDRSAPADRLPSGQRVPLFFGPP